MSDPKFVLSVLCNKEHAWYLNIELNQIYKIYADELQLLVG